MSYAYAGGSPTSLTDPLGLDPFPLSGWGGSAQQFSQYAAAQAAMNSPAAQIAQGRDGLTWNSPSAPDYISFNVDVYVFSGSVTYTRYGDIWVSA